MPLKGLMGQKFANSNYNEPKKRNLDQDEKYCKNCEYICCFVAKLHLSRYARFSVVIFPSFNGNSNIFATFIFNRKAIDKIELLSKEHEKLSMEQNGLQ